MGFYQINRQNNHKNNNLKHKTRRACVRGDRDKTAHTVHPTTLGQTFASYEFFLSLTDIHHS